MRQPLRNIGRLMAIAALGSTLAFAQDAGFGVAFKLRAGVGLGTNYDNLSRRTLGFGLEAGYGGSWGRVAAELGYQYKPGDQYAEDLSKMQVLNGQLPPSTDPNYGNDLRRNSLEGMTLRLSYAHSLGNTNTSLRAGVQLGGAKFRHEYIADVNSNDASPKGSSYEDTYNGTPTKSVIGLAPFVGVSFDVTDSSTLEVNLVGVSYTAIHYNHVAGTSAVQPDNPTAFDTITEHKRMVPTLEIGYAFRF